jgi:para-aminobenzoate synthetase
MPDEVRPMRTLLIDNYDSFTYNLFQLLGEINGSPPVVVQNDDRRAWRALELANFDNIVISPGPGRPDRSRDFGVCADAIVRRSQPLLGVCLGHQGLCMVLGGSVTHAPTPMHGRLSEIHHDQSELFAGIPSPFRAVRYHSLLVGVLPPELEATAVTADGLLMAVRHRSAPMWGVQFHPESIATEHGRRLLANFRDLTVRHRPPRPRRPTAAPRPPPVPAPQRPRRPRYQLLVRRIPMPAAEEVFEAMFAREHSSFWLDTSLVVPGLSRFSFMGCGGPLAELVTYDVGARRVTVRRAGGIETVGGSLFTYLERELEDRRTAVADVPFEFNLGYVGYLGYELKGDCGARAPHRSDLPDAALLFCDRMLAIDHREACAYLLALATPATRDAALGWLCRAELVVQRLPAEASPAGNREADPGPDPHGWPMPVTVRHGLEDYRRLIGDCLREIRDGESYEICLTNMLGVDVSIDRLRTYRALRRISPAPFAALLNFPGYGVLSSSPERFLKVDADRMVESKPIKGTRRRGSDPREDAALARDLRDAEKDRAENLMIVDLVRNDLGRVCQVGSVHVPSLFDVETYRTVHQLVSTIRGRLREDVSPVACVRAAFPGGSMTGAPKLRTMEILDGLEQGSRGIYSGALGYFALSGAIDLSIVIRTIIAEPHRVSIGAGGAIVAQSRPDAEVNEMLLKANGTLQAVAQATGRACLLADREYGRTPTTT